MEQILVTIGDRFAPEARTVLSGLGPLRVLTCNRAELLRLIRTTTVLLVGLDEVIDRQIIDAGPHLKLIATATTGTDHIDLAHAKRKGIPVLSLKGNPGLATVSSTAELAIGLMIDLLRNTHAAAAAVKQDRWDREAFIGRTLAGRTLGIVGLGRLGTIVARCAKALGMRVLYADPAVRTTAFERVSMDVLLKESDVVSLHVHLDTKTEGMFDDKTIRKMKKGAYLVNTARGGLIDERAVVAALNEKRLAGFAADVLSDELTWTAPSNSPLVVYAKTHDNVIVTPHIGGMTVESRVQTDVLIAEEIAKALRSKKR